MCNIVVCFLKQLRTQKMMRLEEIEERLEMCETCMRQKERNFVKEGTYDEVRHHYTKKYWERIYNMDTEL